jgi:antirestriction protein ArdC
VTDVLSDTPARADIYQRVTDEIVKAVEAGTGSFVMPWHGLCSRPCNAFTGDAYRGINVLVLWSAARAHKYLSWYWGTFLQWKTLGAQVRRGEKATPIVVYKQVPVMAEDATTGEPVEDYRLIARLYFVFNAAQVDGWTQPQPWPNATVVSDAVIDDFIAATGADIRQGEIAMYSRSADYISVPDRRLFLGSKTSTVTECYYSTVFHELVHWTGHRCRLGRNLSGRFGSKDYAMEELVAELGAAYLCAEFFMIHTPRKDHSAYIGEWLEVLKGDKRAIFSAANKAVEAANFLLAS